MNVFIRALMVIKWYCIILAAVETVTFAAESSNLQTLKAQDTISLVKMNALKENVSLSGLSAGGFMAVQFHVAHSQYISGVGIFAGGPYYCAQGSLLSVKERCMQPRLPIMLPHVKTLIEFTDNLVKLHKIDDTQFLNSTRVFLFTGTKDNVVAPSVMNILNDFYKHYTESKNIIFKNDLEAGHGMITRDYGQACDATMSPYINNCGYDAAGQVLQHIYGSLNPPSLKFTGKVLAFNQHEFLPDEGEEPYKNDYSFSSIGYVYIPEKCQQQQCRIHVFFHGCSQGAETLQTEVINHAGFNRWADTNAIIVLYPQIKATINPKHPLKNNPMGCWDWWGYTSDDYYSQQAPQIIVIKKMLERLQQQQ